MILLSNVRCYLLACCRCLRQSGSRFFRASLLRRIMGATAIALLMSLIGPVQKDWAQATQSNQNPPENLKQVSLEELGQIEVTTASKVPVKATRTPAAIYVITQEDIRRSGATSIPEASAWRLVLKSHGSTPIRGPSVCADSRAHSPGQCSYLWMAVAFTRLCLQAFIGRSKTHCLNISNGSKYGASELA